MEWNVPDRFNAVGNNLTNVTLPNYLSKKKKKISRIAKGRHRYKIKTGLQKNKLFLSLGFIKGKG